MSNGTSLLRVTALLIAAHASIGCGGGDAQHTELTAEQDLAATSWPNVALNKPTTGSLPCAPSEGPEKAVNGSVSGGNSDKWCSTLARPFLQVDLGGLHSLHRIVVRHAGAGGEPVIWNTRDFAIAFSTDGVSFSSPI